MQLPPFPVYDLQKAELISGARSVACSGSVSLSLSVCHRPELTRPAFPLLRATVNLPPATVASGQEVFAGIGACGPAGCPALQISANTGSCRLSGSLFSAANETSLRSG